MSHTHDDKRLPAPAADKPTLEALLRLKRAERPATEFWEEFDRGLRQKQLAAIIEPRPWWLGLSLLARRLAPVGLPVSAAAAALIAVMVVRTQAPLDPVAARAGFSPLQAEAAVAHSSASVVASASTPALATPRIASVAPEADLGKASLAPAAVLAPVSEPALASVVPPSTPSVSAPAAKSVADAMLDLAPAASLTPSEQVIERNMAEAVAESPALVASADVSFSSAPAAASDDAHDADALKMVVVNPRHARVLLAMANNDEVQAASGIGQLRDQLVRSLDDSDALSASARRLGVGGDRFSVSF